MKRLLFIYNPHAGKELLKPKLADVIDIFVKAGYEVVAYPTQAYRDAYKKIKKYDSSEYDLIVCSGGDGTLDEVVTGMMKRDRDKREPIGYFCLYCVIRTVYRCILPDKTVYEECSGTSGICAGRCETSVQYSFI